MIRDDYDSLPSYVQGALADWPRNVNRVTAWWIAQKRKWAYNLVADLDELNGSSGLTLNRADESITVVVPISPIKSHPEIAILEETLKTIRTHLPEAEIYLMFDGVRPEQEDRRSDYEEHIRRVLWKCLHEWKNVLPFVFDEHLHQSGMVKKVLPEVKSPALLFVEHDTPLTPDCSIDFLGIIECIKNGSADVVRLHHEALILPDHEHLMLDHATVKLPITKIEIDDEGLLPLRRTKQWSQRPHVASTAYYRRIMGQYFSEQSKSFIEDRMHGVLEGEVEVGDITTWHNHRLWVYHPETGNIKRSYTTDGRAGGEKYDDTQIF